MYIWYIWYLLQSSIHSYLYLVRWVAITNLTAPARSPLLFQPPKLPQELLSLCLFSMPSGYYNKQKQNRSYLPCPDCLIFSSETWKDALLDSCSDRVIHSKSGREAMLGCTRRAERKASQVGKNRWETIGGWMEWLGGLGVNQKSRICHIVWLFSLGFESSLITNKD